MTLSSATQIMGLKGELKDLKQSSLSGALVILVNYFIPKHYKKYIEFNVCCGDGWKRYASGIP